MVVTTEAAFSASMNARSDALPVLLQVGAVGLVANRTRPRTILAAAGLASLAFVTKLTAVWGPIGIAVWLLLENRKYFFQFLASYLGFTGALVGVFALATHGRLFTNVFGLSTAGISGLGPLIRSPYRFFFEAIPHALAGWMLVPIMGVAVWLAVRERRVSIWLLSLGAYVVVLMVMFADRGVGWNQLIDMVVLSALVVGELAGRAPHYPRVGALAIGLLAGTVLWANLTGLALLLGPEIKNTRDPAFQQTLVSHPLAGRADTSTRILAEDPYVPVSLDQRPVVLDPFMLITVGQRDPSAVQALVRRIDEREFDLLVLRVSLQDRSMAWWFRQEAFGETVADAMRRNYVYSYWVAGYYVYVPRPASGPT
jgi:hypothetical protein